MKKFTAAFFLKLLVHQKPGSGSAIKENARF
jgi:hypothetical protein